MFRCLCFPWLRPYTTHKLDDRSKPCVFVGYSLTQSAYPCLHRATGQIYVSLHVQFDEGIYPFQHSLTRTPSPDKLLLQSDITQVTPLQAHRVLSSTPPSPPASVLHSNSPSQLTTTPSLSSPVSAPVHPPPLSTIHQVSSSTNSKSLYSPSSPRPIGQAQNTNHQLGEPTATISTQKPTGPTQSQINHNIQHALSTTTQRPTGRDPLTNTQPTAVLPQPSTTSSLLPAIPTQNTHQMKTRSKNQIIKPNTKCSLTTALNSLITPEPTTYIQALKDPNWRYAMSEEFDG